MRAGLLGPLLFELDSRDGSPTAQKQRQLLALLLVNDSRVVTMPTLVEELWERPPRSATTVIQTYVLSIRKHTSAMLQIDQSTVASELLQTRGRGYAFNTNACIFDVHRYTELIEQARTLLAAGYDDAAIGYFTRAEQLWRGEALADVECGLPLSTEAARLGQIQLTNVELRLEAQLRQRRYQDVVVDLTALVLQHPLNERLHAYLMYALGLSGWRARAQKVFTNLRQAMIEELGLEPCAKVQRLHQDILRASDAGVRALLEDNHSEYLFWHGNAARRALSVTAYRAS